MMIRADVKCYYCGHVSGQMEGDPSNSDSQWNFRTRTGLIQPVRQKDQRIRCDRCGGPVYLDDVETIRTPERAMEAALAS